MSNSDRSQGKQGFFGGWNASQRCPPAGGSGSTSRVGPLKATSLLLHDEPTFFGGRQPFTGHVARWFVKRTIRSHALWIAALYVEVEARSNMEAMIGRFDTVSVEFQQVKFKRIQVTGGARFELLGVDLLTLAFLPGPLKPSPRFNLPCEVTGTATFTNTDLNLSPAIRCFAQMVVNNVLEPLRTKASAAWIGWPAQAKTPSRVGSGVGEGEQGQEQEGDQKKRESPVNVTTVRVHGRKLAVEGEVTNTEPLLRMRFRCEFSLSTSHDGHVIQIRDPSVFWGMSSGRVPLPVRPYTIDLGDRARIENLSISKGTLCVGVRFILSPVEHLNVSPPDVHRGDIQHDLAETLSTLICGILRFKRD